jgi:1-acyl-sn-glycerol-3-phosphate acyltransferase
MAVKNPDIGIKLLTPAAWLFYTLTGGYRASGMENIPKKGAAILAGNHLSWADPPVVRIAFNRTCWFMANDFLFKIPVFGSIIRSIGAFPVVRGRFDRDAFRAAEEKLARGHLLNVFPEGGTSLTGKLSPFEGGVAMLAMRSGAPLVPFAITGTDRLMPMTTKGPKPPRWIKGGVSVKFGPPIHHEEIAPDLPKRERLDKITHALYLAVADLLPPDYLPDPLWDGTPFKAEHPERS